MHSERRGETKGMSIESGMTERGGSSIRGVSSRSFSSITTDTDASSMQQHQQHRPQHGRSLATSSSSSTHHVDSYTPPQSFINLMTMLDEAKRVFGPPSSMGQADSGSSSSSSSSSSDLVSVCHAGRLLHSASSSLHHHPTYQSILASIQATKAETDRMESELSQLKHEVELLTKKSEDLSKLNEEAIIRKQQVSQRDAGSGEPCHFECKDDTKEGRLLLPSPSDLCWILGIVSPCLLLSLYALMPHCMFQCHPVLYLKSCCAMPCLHALSLSLSFSRPSA